MALRFLPAETILSPLITEGVVHGRPVIVLWRPAVRRGAQLAPGPLVIGAAASSVAVGFLTERV